MPAAAKSARPIGRRSAWLEYAAPVALCAIVFAIPFAIAVEAALHFSGVAIDGPFQLYNGLRRIAAGYRPGVDFQFFHGMGILYLHYPFFRLFRSGLAGAEAARQLLSTCVFPLVFLAVFRAFTGDWRRAWYLTAAGLAMSIALHLTALTNPVNGMLGLRSTLPTLISAVFLVVRGRLTRVVAIGALLGTALFVSTEQGIAAILAFVLVSAISLVRPADRAGRLGAAAATLVIGVATFGLLLVVVAGRTGAAGILAYNFRAVPRDEYWYFGAPPNAFISSWAQLPGMLVHARPIGIGLVLVAASAVLCLARVARPAAPDVEHRRDALALLATYGVISCASLLGIFAAAYVQPAWRVLVILALLLISSFADRRVERGSVRSPVSPVLPVTALAAIVWMAIATPSVLSIARVSLPHLVVEHVVHRQGFGVAGIWPETLREDDAVMSAMTQRSGGKAPSVWSTYAGWLEARHGVFHPSFDYIIHALGPSNRARYLQQFRAAAPDLVQTVRPGYSQYEAWVESTSWPLYEDLLSRYAIVQTTPWSIFWAKQSAAAPEPQFLGEAPIDQANRTARLPTVPASPGMPVTLLTVEVTYSVRNPLGFLPLVGANPRYLVGIDGAVSRTPVTLDPFTTVARFPVVAAPGTTPSLAFHTFSLLPRASLQVQRVRVWQTPVVPANQEWLAELVRTSSS